MKTEVRWIRTRPWQILVRIKMSLYFLLSAGFLAVFVPPVFAINTMTVDDGDRGSPVVEQISDVTAAGTDSLAPNDKIVTSLLAPASKIGDVNQASGAFQFSIPVDVPSGVNGLSPVVALSYSSDGSSENNISPGFSLTVDDCLSRFSPPAYDGKSYPIFSHGAPSFTDNDTFYLGGGRITSCSNQIGGASASCPNGSFRSFNNNFELVEKQPSTVPDGWRVTKRDGTVYEYGYQKIKSGTSATFANTTTWCLSRIVRDGNQINYNYVDFGSGEQLLSTIDYGGVGASPHLWRVSLNWTSRTDQSESYSSGTQVKITKRLSDISVLRILGDTVIQQKARYHFDYDNTQSASGHYRLQSVTQYGTDNTHHMPPYIFTYPFDYTGFDMQFPVPANLPLWFGYTDRQQLREVLGPNNLGDNMGLDLLADYDLHTVIADLNGDGYADMFRRASISDGRFSPTAVWLNNGNGWTENTDWETAFNTVPYFGNTMDLGVVSIPGVVTGKSKTSGAFMFLPTSYGASMVDLNGDGKPDIVRYYTGGKNSYDSGFNGFCNDSDNQSTAWVGIYDQTMNGGKGGYNTTLGQPYCTAIKYGLSFPERDQNTIRPGCGSDRNGTPGHIRPEFVDINNDGLIDVITSFEEPTYEGYFTLHQRVLLNNGHGFVTAPSSQFALPVGLLQRTDYCNQDLIVDQGVRLTDVNGDGLPDVVQSFQTRSDYPGGPSPTAPTNVWINNGSSFIPSNLSLSVPQVFNKEVGSFGYINSSFFGYLANLWQGALPIDIDGDSKEDIASSICQGLSGAPDGVQSSSSCVPQTDLAPRSQALWRSTSDWRLPIPLGTIWNKPYPRITGPNCYSPEQPSVGHFGCYHVGAFFDHHVKFGDVNGDGMSDVLIQSQYTNDQGGNNADSFMYFNNLPVDHDRIRNIKNPFGGNTTIHYVRANALNGNPNLIGGKLVVSDVTTNNGTGGNWSATTNYQYFGGRFDTQSKSFTGFRLVITQLPTDSSGTKFVSSWFKNGANDYCAIGAKEASIVSTSICGSVGGTSRCIYKNGTYDPDLDQSTVQGLGIYETESTSYKNCPAISAQSLWGPYYVPPREIDRVSYDPSVPSLPLVTRQTLAYDSFGNLTSSNDYISAGDLTPYRTNWATYVAPSTSGPWIVDHPCKNGLATFEGGTRKERRLSVTYYDNSSSQCQIGSQGRATKIDSFGYNLDYPGMPASHTWKSISYTTAGNVATVTDALNHTSYSYWQDPTFPEILVSSDKNALMQTTAYDYDALGRLIAVTDPNNVVSNSQYDELNRPLYEWQDTPDLSLAASVLYEYLNFGNPNTQYTRRTKQLDTDRTISEENHFDGMGRTYLSINTGGAQSIAVSTAYDSRGQVIQRTAPYYGTLFNLNNASSIFEYDPLGRVKKTTTPGGYYSTKKYSIYSTGSMLYKWEDLKTVNNLGHDVRTHYLTDVLGRLVKVAQCNTANCDTPQAGTGIEITGYRYDAIDNRTDICMADGDGSCTSGTRARTFYDGLGRVIAQKDPDMSNCADPTPADINSGCPWRYEYDEGGNLQRQTDARQIVEGTTDDNLFTYDQLNRIATRTATYNGKTSSYVYEYDDPSILCTGTTQNSYVTGRLVRETLQISNSLTHAVEETSVNCYRPDSLGRIRSKTTSITLNGRATQTATIRQAYNSMDQVVAKYLPNGTGTETVRYFYDDLGRVNSLRTTQGTTTSILASNVTYNADGEETGVDLGNGLHKEQKFNEVAGFSASMSPAGDRNLNLIEYRRSDNTKMLSLSYSHDSLSNVRQIYDVTRLRTELYDYDYLNRISTFTLNGQLQETYSYDLLGNRTIVASQPSAPSLKQKRSLIYNGLAQSTLTYGAANSGAGGPHALKSVSSNTAMLSLSGFQYDGNGNLTLGTDPSNGATSSYSYGPHNKVIFAQTALDSLSYSYGPKQEKLAYVDTNDLGSTANYFFDADYEIRGNMRVSNYYLNGKLLASKQGTNPFWYHLTDQLGSVRKVIDQNLVVQRTIDYTPFGSSTESGPGSVSYRFNGNEKDSSGVYDYNARTYDPRLGVFLQPDAYIPDLANPQSLNRYAYVYNNPLNHTDPSGHFPWLIVMAIQMYMQHQMNQAFADDPSALAVSEAIFNILGFVEMGAQAYQQVNNLSAAGQAKPAAASTVSRTAADTTTTVTQHAADSVVVAKPGASDLEHQVNVAIREGTGNAPTPDTLPTFQAAKEETRIVNGQKMHFFMSAPDRNGVRHVLPINVPKSDPHVLTPKEAIFKAAEDKAWGLATKGMKSIPEVGPALSTTVDVGRKVATTLPKLGSVAFDVKPIIRNPAAADALSVVRKLPGIIK